MCPRLSKTISILKPTSDKSWRTAPEFYPGSLWCVRMIGQCVLCSWATQYSVLPYCRAPLEMSRKWGSYYIANLLLKTYFKLNSASLSKNILNSLRAGGRDMPAFSNFPRSQQITFKYHQGVLAFLEENYVDVRPPPLPLRTYSVLTTLRLRNI